MRDYHDEHNLFGTISKQIAGRLSGSSEATTIWGSLIAIGAPALLMVFCYHLFLPWLMGAGLAAAESYVVAHVAPMAVMLSVALAVFH
jgi:hypothetical protein